MTIEFYSHNLDVVVTADYIDELNPKRLYILMDELESHKEILEKQLRKIHKNDLGDSSFVVELKYINTLYITAKRRAHFLNKSRIKQITDNLDVWKRRAYILGEKLDMNKSEVEKLKIYGR